MRASKHVKIIRYACKIILAVFRPMLYCKHQR